MTDGTDFEFRNEISQGVIPASSSDPRSWASRRRWSGGCSRLPDDRHRVALYDGSYTRSTLGDGLQGGGLPRLPGRRDEAAPALLEPIMEVEVVTPEDYMGDVIATSTEARPDHQHGAEGRLPGVTAHVRWRRCSAMRPIFALPRRGGRRTPCSLITTTKCPAIRRSRSLPAKGLDGLGEGRNGQAEVRADDKPHVNIGTIGPIDHGKTTLTAAITKTLAAKKLAEFVPFDRSTRRRRRRRGDHDQHGARGVSESGAHYAHVELSGHADVHQEHDHRRGRRWTVRCWWCRRRTGRCADAGAHSAGAAGWGAVHHRLHDKVTW